MSETTDELRFAIETLKHRLLLTQDAATILQEAIERKEARLRALLCPRCEGTNVVEGFCPTSGDVFNMVCPDCEVQ